ncbi:MAG TPA: carboxypeptidase-like regulatory domain-containing protein [Pyrinomonadaceae bacterium]|nr:carboxypeptidase-like regulatory domain-containing protein [Pyrinomonadaceae bacterium]
MRKLIFATLLIAATSGAAFAQNGGQSPDNNDIPNMGRAPKQADGVGRLDLRVVDEDGNPVKGVRADLQSNRSGGFLCESWNWTDARGVSVLPPLHMGKLSLKLSAKGYETQKLEVNAADLDQPVRIVLHRK